MAIYGQEQRTSDDHADYADGLAVHRRTVARIFASIALWEAVAGSVRGVGGRRWTCADLIILPQGQTILTYRNQMTNVAGCTPPTSPMSHRPNDNVGEKVKLSTHCRMLVRRLIDLHSLS